MEFTLFINKMNLLRRHKRRFQVNLINIVGREKIRENGQDDQRQNHQATNDRDCAAAEPAPDQLEITFVPFRAFYLEQARGLLLTPGFQQLTGRDLGIHIVHTFLSTELTVPDPRVENGQENICQQVAEHNQNAVHQQKAAGDINILRHQGR